MMHERQAVYDYTTALFYSSTDHDQTESDRNDEVTAECSGPPK
jgi:hypothetical protein